MTMQYEGIGWNPLIGTQVRYDLDTMTSEAWITGEGGENFWEPVEWQRAVEIGAPVTNFGPVQPGETAPFLTEEMEEIPLFDVPPPPPPEQDSKPWYDRVLPGDQDSLNDLVPDFLEPDEGDTFFGAIVDPFIPGDQDSLSDLHPVDEIKDTVTSVGSLFGGGLLGALLPLMVIGSMFNNRD